jgi:hypothetical protein
MYFPNVRVTLLTVTASNRGHFASRVGAWIEIHISVYVPTQMEMHVDGMALEKINCNRHIHFARLVDTYFLDLSQYLKPKPPIELM